MPVEELPLLGDAPRRLHGISLRQLLRNGADDAMLRTRITNIWTQRSDRYSELRHAATVREHKIEMSYIGG